MRALAHFSAGVAVTSCLPAAVRAGADGNPLYFILGGLFGLLPDALDFHVSRFLWRRDVEVAPDPLRLDAQLVADAVAETVNRVFERGRPLTLQLDAIQLAADLWQRYEIRFDTARRAVVVTYGPVVDARRPAASTAPPATAPAEARAPVLCDLRIEDRASVSVDVLQSVVFRIEPGPERSVTLVSGPWRLGWSHSYATHAVCGFATGLLLGPMAGLVAFLAAAAHSAMDQTGFLGSRVLFPFRPRRAPGLQWMRPDATLPNLAATWCAGLLILWNLCVGMTDRPFALNPLRFAFWGLGVPLAAVALGRRLFRPAPGSRHGAPRPRRAERPGAS